MGADTEESPGRDLLRFTTAGSVDDGKSTLIGRLLADSGALTADQVAALSGSAGDGAPGGFDLARVTDGLVAEREQGITIDVAYRYFATAKRSFIVADVPGHEQYTRNMVTGASKASAALVLVDVRNGMTRQTRRHICIAGLLGLKQIVFAINKIDLVGYDEAVFGAVRDAIATFCARLPFSEVHYVPVSAKHGDNVVAGSAATPWYRGGALLESLESLPPSAAAGEDLPLRLPVQFVSRPGDGDNPDVRGYMGRIASGRVRVGDAVRILPGGARTTVTGVHTPDGAEAEATCGRSVTVTVADQIDIGRGHMICDADDPPRDSSRIDALLCWLDAQPQDPRGTYLLQAGARTVLSHVDVPAYRIDVDTLERAPGATSLEANEIGAVHIQTRDSVAFDPFARNPGTGGFILIDPRTNNTVAAGMFEHQL